MYSNDESKYKYQTYSEKTQNDLFNWVNPKHSDNCSYSVAVIAPGGLGNHLK